MKRRIAALLAVLLLTACFAPLTTAGAATDVCFVSVNDRLLDLGSKAENVYGGWYVPCTAFADFGISYSFFQNSSTAMLFTAKQQFFFDLVNGTTYDASNNYYSTYGVLLNGVAYVPVSFVCSQFGLSWSYISGYGYGDICRIKDASAVLTDAQFLSAASNQMAAKYAAYMSAVNPAAAPSATPTKQPAGSRTVYLSFQGIPSDTVLSALKSAGVTATFFLTPEEIEENADVVRHIIGDGHYAGILCADADTFRKGADALYEAAHYMTVLAAAPEGEERACSTMAGKNGLVYCSFNIDGVRNGEGLKYITYVTANLTAADNYARILCGEAADVNIKPLLSYFAANNCQAVPTDEINHGK